MKFFAILTAILLLARVAGPAQVPAGQTDAESYKFSVRSNLVFLPTRVQSKKGETIYGLQPEQFIVEDNGVRQSVQIDEGPDSSGVSLVVAIQCSRSATSEFNKIRGLGAMIGAIVGAAPHEVSIVSYGAGPCLLGDFSSRADAVGLALSKLKRCDDYGAASIDTVDYAINLLKRRPNHYRRAILLIGETRDHGSRAKLDEVVAELGITDTVIYSVAFSPTRDQALRDLRHGDHPPPAPAPTPPPETNSSSSTDQQPNYAEKPPLFELPPEILLLINALRRNTASELASLSGGEYVNFTTQRGFDDSLQRISNRIHNYYLLSFKPAPGQALGLHSLRVRVPDYPDAVIQTRKSYWPGVPDARP
jgi:VWFA-related protein